MPVAAEGKVVFIAHPLRGDEEKNLKNVERYIRFAIAQKNIHPCCPWYAMVKALDDRNDRHRLRGLQANFAILARCDELWVCGPKITEGVKEEIEVAQTWRIPIVYVKGLEVGEYVLERVNKRLTGAP